MSQVLPTVRYLIVCEDVQIDPDHPRQVTLRNLLSTTRSLEEPRHPLHDCEPCLFAHLTECRGPGDVPSEVRFADTDNVMFRNRTQTLQYPTNPLEPPQLFARLRNCLLPRDDL